MPDSVKAPETKAPLTVPENRTKEKIEMENRRLRGYVAAFKAYADRNRELRELVRGMVAAPPLGMVGVDAYAKRLELWRESLRNALEAIAAAERDAHAKDPAKYLDAT